MISLYKTRGYYSKEKLTSCRSNSLE